MSKLDHLPSEMTMIYSITCYPTQCLSSSPLPLFCAGFKWVNFFSHMLQWCNGKIKYFLTLQCVYVELSHVRYSLVTVEAYDCYGNLEVSGEFDVQNG